MENKVRFYHALGGRKAFIALLFFVVTFLLFIGQNWLSFSIEFSELASFWKWDAGIFVSGNVGSKCVNAVTKWFEKEASKNANNT